MWRARSGRTPSRDSASSKIAGSGFAAPASAGVTTAENHLARPSCSSFGTGSTRSTSVPFASSVTASRSASRPTSMEHIAVADRHFTPEEANALLPEVSSLAAEMVSHRRLLAVATVRHARVATKIAGNGGGVRPHDVDELGATIEREAAEVARCVEELNALGVLVKDLDQGLVDFPAWRGDEEVLLC